MDTNPLTLRELNENDEQAFLLGLKEWEGTDLRWYSFEWKPGMLFSELLARERNNSAGVDLPAGFVPSTMFYGFVDNLIVGRLHIRHSLNDNLRHRGGHIGYAVAPRFRGLGYAGEMLKQSLPICRKLGIPGILITCDDDNIPSWKVIEKHGGIIKDKVYDAEDKKQIRRYWIKLEPLS